MNSKGIILFDIDRTIFDTDKQSELFYKNILNILGSSDLDRLKEIKHDYKLTLENDTVFEPEEYVKRVAEDFGYNNPDLLNDVFYGNKYSYIYKDSVYPETTRVLSSLKNTHRLGIFSEGTRKFQNHKFNSMGILDLLDKDLIFIFDLKTNSEALSKIPKEATIIDDKESVCKYVTENGFKAIWLNKMDKEISDKFTTIHDLTELPKLLL